MSIPARRWRAFLSERRFHALVRSYDCVDVRNPRVYGDSALFRGARSVYFSPPYL